MCSVPTVGLYRLFSQLIQTYLYTNQYYGLAQFYGYQPNHLSSFKSLFCTFESIFKNISFDKSPLCV